MTMSNDPREKPELPGPVIPGPEEPTIVPPRPELPPLGPDDPGFPPQDPDPTPQLGPNGPKEPPLSHVVGALSHVIEAVTPRELF
jgi:hypothetical protein